MLMDTVRVAGVCIEMVGNSSIPTKPFVINRENLVLSSKELEISEATGRDAGEQMPLLCETRSGGLAAFPCAPDLLCCPEPPRQ